MSSEIKNQSSSFVHHQTQNAKTILITNNYTQNGGIRGGGASESGVCGKVIGNGSATNSITILTGNAGDTERVVESGSGTVVLDRINICINNHYDSAVAGQVPVVNIKTDKTMREEQTYGMMPPSTSILKYKQGEDVLVLQKDGRFYLGTVVLAAPNQCLVQFDDNTKKWATYDELKRFGTSHIEDDAPLCVVCKVKEKGRTVEVCEQCGRGYHRDCTQGNFGENGVWFCRRCTAQNGIKTFDQNNESRPVITCKQQLAYDLDALNWDKHHRTNTEKIYCYCGTDGNWLERMLQCNRCQQWFHDKCLQSLSYPLFAGDRFYVFVCSMCNSGNEFLRRLEMNWTDLIHLLLFNLSFYNNPIEYFDLADVITPYFMELNKVLQLPDYMNNLAQLAIQQKFLIILRANDNRFKSTHDLKAWGLRPKHRQPRPPNTPFIFLPNDGETVTETYVYSIWAEKKQLLGFVRRSTSEVIGNLQDWYKKIQGKQYVSSIYLYQHQQKQHENTNHEKHHLVADDFDEDDEIPVKFIIQKDKVGKFSGCKTIGTPSTSSVSSVSSIRDQTDETSRDSIVISVKPFASTTKRRLRKRLNPNTISGPPLKKNKSEKLSIPSPEDSSNDDDTSSRSTLDHIIPPPKDFQGSNNPFNPIYVPQVSSNKQEQEKESVNNEQKTGKKLTKAQIDGGKVRIVRTIRRRLSAKDIIIGPNQEVKYKRKSKHNNADVEVISTTTISSGTSVGTFLPMRTEFTGNGTPKTKLSLFSSCSSSSLAIASTSSGHSSSSRSRSFKDKDRHSTGSSSGYSSTATSIANGGGYSSLPSSPNGKNGFLGEMSPATYFDMGSRIKSGEKFVVRGKRTTPNGTQQYLIEWSGKKLF